MTNKRRFYWLIAAAFFAIIFTVAACKKGGETGGGGGLYGTYDQNAMLTNIGNSVIISTINNFAASSEAAATSIASFVNNPDATSLTAAQASVKTLMLSWAATAPFDFGPLSDNLWYAKIDTWPVNPVKIETAISANADASTQGSDAKGLKALEYLLFDKSGNDAVIAKYQGNDNSVTNRKNYLVSVSKNLSDIATDLKNSWSGSYLTTFTNSKGNDVSSSISLLVNTFSLYLDEVKNLKIGNPIGMGIKVNDGQPHPDKIEYLLTEESLAAMVANMQTMKSAFNGGNGQGLDDLLDYVKAQKSGQNLSKVVNDLFDNIIGKMNAISTPYATAVTNQTTQLNAIYDSLKQLIAYFKVDIANNLGVTITFSDTDGD